MNSLRSRLIVGSAGLFAVGFLIAGIAVYASSRSTMYAEFDETLRATVKALAALTHETDEGVNFQFTEGFEEFAHAERPSYYEVWLDGKVLTRSAQLTKGDLAFGYGSLRKPDFTSIQLPDGRSGRQASVTFQPKATDFGDDDDFDDDDDDEDDRYEAGEDQFRTSVTSIADALEFETAASPTAHELVASPTESGILTLTWDRPERHVTIAVARDTIDIEQRLSSLRWILASVGAAIAALSLSMLVLVVHQGLKPVESVTRAIMEIDENSLDGRVPADKVPAEIAPMVFRLNDLLGRLEAAFHRERAFSSNLAHELRTPLAGLKSTLEVYLSRTHQPEEYQQALQACLQICDQSHNLVENLLSLARVEGNTLCVHSEPLKVDEIFCECWQPLSEEAESKQLRTEFDLSAKVINTDREMLRIILRNVLSNAVCYSDQGGRIEAAIKNSGGFVSVCVSNTGHTLTPTQVGKVFDRLWRGDQSRGHTGEHFGLGLTLAKRFSEALGGSVSVTVDEMFHVSLSLPVDASCGEPTVRS